MKLLQLALFGLSMVLLTAPADAAIEIIANSTVAYVFDQDPEFSYSSWRETTIPNSAAVDAIAGASHSYNNVNWSTSGGQTILSFDMDHQKSGTLYSGAGIGNNIFASPTLFFTPDSNSTYQLSGYYHVTDVGANESGVVGQFASLNDEGPNLEIDVILFRGSQVSYATRNEQFTLGGTGGDHSNELIGSLTGNLIAGHRYRMDFGSFIGTNEQDVDLGASAVGNLTLTIGEAPAVVPEASAFLVWGCLIIGGIAFYHGRRAARAASCLSLVSAAIVFGNFTSAASAAIVLSQAGSIVERTKGSECVGVDTNLSHPSQHEGRSRCV